MQKIKSALLPIAINVLVCLCWASAALALPSFTSSVQDLGGGRWAYDYTITNDLTDRLVNEFDISFSYGLYQNLQVEAVPSDWFGQVFEPGYDATGPQDGFLNVIANGQGLQPGSSIGGFSVSFEWLGFDTPLDNDYQVFSCVTAPYQEQENPPVPEPGTVLLLGIGLIGLAGCRNFLQTRNS